MELIDVMQTIMLKSMQAAQLTDFIAGTVVSANPLKIQISAEMPPLESPSLILTSAVIEKKIHGLTSHIYCTENSERLPTEENAITINRGLSAGDSVVLLRVCGGSRFIVLSRTF